ncbi:hypothetical protein [Fibrobacter sp.]|uniref:hypothetical protein n=1 Tax=Fibrobacter sp. TaxID=35828 RepID=UPI00386668DA
MKKIALLLIFLAIPSFAIYVDAGLGIGGSSTDIDDTSVDKVICNDCDELAATFGVRVGGQITERFWIAGELSGLGHRYYDSDAYVQFNSYLFGPSFIFYPVDHLHLSGSIGLSWTANDTDIRGLDMYDGTGGAIEFTAAYDTGVRGHGALIGMRLFSSTNELKESEKDLSMVGVTFFVAYVHK